jgi:serine/threonine protein kinase
MPLQPGDRLGPYEILAPIGGGGMGEVWKARDTRLDRIVAIKTSKVEFSERFEREARAVAALNHPNICHLYDVAKESGVDYLVMEYVSGKSLDKFIPSGGLPVSTVISLGHQITHALAAAHASGIVHRDLKPANVVITDSGIAKVLDFGLAKRADPSPAPSTGEHAETATIVPALTIQGSIVGTANYMSPEQAQGMPVDARSDIFSLGTVLYEMRTGSRAFNGPTTVATLAAILRDEVAPPITLGFPGPPRLDDLIRRCLQKRPEDRWQTMDEIQAELAILQNYSNYSDDALSIAAPSIPAPPSDRPPVHYAGFWIRAAARVIDMVIVGMAMSILRFILKVPLLQEETFTLAVACLYEVYFVSRQGATIGKIGLNLKIVRADGSAVTRSWALRRYFAMGVSLLTGTVGFWMAAFDKEKRALHDRICATRVIRGE